jgi:hypothetical protein
MAESRAELIDIFLPRYTNLCPCPTIPGSALLCFRAGNILQINESAIAIKKIY